MKKVIYCAFILLGCFAGAARADDPYEAGLAIIDGEGFAGLDRAVEQFKVAVELPGRARDARLGIARARILQYELSGQPQSAWLDEARAELDILIRARAMDAASPPASPVSAPLAAPSAPPDTATAISLTP